MFGLPIQNKNSAINALLLFLFDFFELKERVHTRTKRNSQKKCLHENHEKCLHQYHYYFHLTKIRVGQPIQQKIKKCIRLSATMENQKKIKKDHQQFFELLCQSHKVEQ